VLEGSVTLWQEGEDDIVGKAGDVVKVPLKQVHNAITTEEGASILVFRVHEQGQPERVPVE
jgi:quercetin dioxygenase-like cupin family protein